MRTSLIDGNNYHLELTIANEKLLGSGLEHYFEKYDFTRLDLMTHPQIIGLHGKAYYFDFDFTSSSRRFKKVLMKQKTKYCAIFFCFIKII